jgi:hypothetical protein
MIGPEEGKCERGEVESGWTNKMGWSPLRHQARESARSVPLPRAATPLAFDGNKPDPLCDCPDTEAALTQSSPDAVLLPLFPRIKYFLAYFPSLFPLELLPGSSRCSGLLRDSDDDERMRNASRCRELG